MGSCVQVEQGNAFEEDTDFYMMKCPSIMHDLIQNEIGEKIQEIELYSQGQSAKAPQEILRSLSERSLQV